MSAIFGETLICRQDNGPDVALVVRGDEFYARHETKDGYSVVYDEGLGLYTYAALHNGSFISSGIPLTKTPPAGTRRHLRESKDVQQRRFNRRYAELRPPETFGSSDVMMTIGPNDGLLEGRRISEGNIRGLTVLVEFSDETSAITAADVDAMLNGDNYTANGNFCSVREYYRLMSSGKLDYSNRVVGPIRLDHTKRFYETTSFVREAMDKAVNDLGVELSEFDSKGDGTVDAVNFMYAGFTVYGINGNNNNPSQLWPHNSVRILRYGGMRTHFYMLTSLGRQPVDLSIGTFCHESGHLLCRWPDLYDYGRRDNDHIDSRGIGPYCLMGAGNHLDHGHTPAPVSAYLRDLVGWTDNKILLNNNGNFEAVHGAYDTLLKFETDKPNEYFLVENRSQIGLDEHSPASGLAVYHCDKEGSNEWQEGSAERHYQCALLQADGRKDLEADVRGDAGDLFGFENGEVLSRTTNPSSREWDGTDSEFIISDVSAPGEVVTFRVGADPRRENIITGDIKAHMLIPDDSAQGIQSSFTVERSGTVKNLEIGVDITHTYRGDLQVELETPSGKRVMLHDRSGSGADDLKKKYKSENTPPLAHLKDDAVEGDWILHVRDLESRDVGRLNSWTIQIEYAPVERIAGAEARPALAIPDADSIGVTHTLNITETGKLKDISVDVAVTHTFIRDLQVVLIAPSGATAMLHNRTGGGADNIDTTYNRTSAPALDTLLNQEINGDWALHVSDLEAADTGALDKWAVKLFY